MDNKRLIFILCFIVLILSLNAFSATTTDKKTNTSMEVSKKVNKNVAVTKNKTVKKASNNIVYVNSNSKSTKEDGSKDSPYKTINNENINKISSNSTVYVSKGTYKLNTTSINNDVSIIGENKNNVIFIPQQNKSTFTIEKRSTVTFKNFTLKNFSSDSSAAITNNGKLIIDNLILQNNVGTARTSKGGSILNNGELEVSNSQFENNTASWGAAIYNTKNAKITKTSFKKNSIYNVGGALYNLGGNLTVYDSRFTENTAVSGAAIYNAAGYTYVNNTEFYKNDAEKFFGGAIYSTGITITNNSNFYLNHATKDGGAITNTNNFTIINCDFEQNSADENGGTIENVPWSAKENGNLTIINSSFIENSAGDDGGVIMNYNKIESVGDYCTVTARNCLFDSNTAGRGAVIYNQQYMDFQYNVLINNKADDEKTVTSDSNLIKSIDNNWWGTNNPTKNSIGVTPKTWIIMKFTNTTALVTNLTAKLQVSLNTLNNGKSIAEILPNRVAVFTAEKTEFPNNYETVNTSINNQIKPLGDTLKVQIDNQELSLKPVNANLTSKLINKNQTIQIKLQMPKNVNGKSTIKADNKTIISNAEVNDGELTTDYIIPTSWTNNRYNLTLIFTSNENMTYQNDNLSLTIPKRKTTITLTVSNKTLIKAGKKIKLTTTVKLGNQTVNTGYVTFKINKKTLKSNVKLVNGKASLTYIIPKTIIPGKYNFTVTYSGDNNKNFSKTFKKITVRKQKLHTTAKNRITVSLKSKKKMTIKLFDELNTRTKISGKACYKINGITYKTNITVKKGVFSFTFKVPKLKNYKTTKQWLTIKYGGNSRYYSFKKNIALTVK